MRTMSKTLIVLSASLLGVSTAAADFDGSKPLMCSFAKVIECAAGSKCRTVSNDSIDAPDFVKFDFRKKEVVSTTAGTDSSPDKIDNVQELDNFLVLQAVQGGSGGTRDALGWSASIDKETGRMTVSASGENAAFVVFGSCAAL